MNPKEDMVETLLEENRLLQERVASLEEELGLHQRKLERDTTQVTGVIKLLKAKDQTLEEYAAELEKKREELEEAVNKLEQNNQRLQLWVSALRLYQDIIENEAAALIGLNKDGMIILYNKATLKMFGDDFKELIGQPLDEVDFSAFDPYTPRLVEAVRKDPELVDREVQVDGRTIHTFAYPMGKGKDFRGVLLKIDVRE